MKVNKDLLVNAPSYNPFEDLPSSAQRQCQLAADLAMAISRYRKRHSLTQTQLAKSLKMNQSQISKLESGDVNLTIERMEEILTQLQYQIEIQPVSSTSIYLESVAGHNNWLDIISPSASPSIAFASA